MRAALLVGLEGCVEWSKKLVDVWEQEGGVIAVFADGTEVAGRMVVGAEGSRSVTRKVLRPEGYENVELPIRFVGASIDMTPAQITPLRELDPLLFQGCHPQTGCFFWFSTLETPEVNGTLGTEAEMYRAQINLSWPVKGPEDELKSTNAERIADMKKRAESFDPRLRDAVAAIPDDEPLLEIKLADWPCYKWDNHDGKMTIIGDAAHAMTMCWYPFLSFIIEKKKKKFHAEMLSVRGEAANHGILDAFNLTNALKEVHIGLKSQKAAMDGFEAEMRTRTSAAVLLSRQACFDAHDWESLTPTSAVLRKRALPTE
jgi:2-polyprenyl-6-methoxyphenol hydroxylase-like FAD-dependent oxidoreductase